MHCVLWVVSNHPLELYVSRCQAMDWDWWTGGKNGARNALLVKKPFLAKIARPLGAGVENWWRGGGERMKDEG